MYKNERDGGPAVLILALFILAAVILGWIFSGCAASHTPDTPPLETVQCEPASCYLFRSDTQGRVDACEACSSTEAEIQARQAELGCQLTAAHAGCSLGGACSWPALQAHWETIRQVQDCATLEEIAASDPCTRPDPELYWRENGGCE